MSDEASATGAAPAAVLPATLAMTQLIDCAGAYPQRSGGPPVNSLAMIHSFAGTYEAFGALPCAGQQMSQPQNIPLVSLTGPAYGSSDEMHFDLPDLRGRMAAGGNPVGGISDGSLAMTYMIAADAGVGVPGSYPMIGAIGLFAGSFAPAGWLAADGSPFAIPQDIPLFEAIGSAFGGNGETFFLLPNLNGRAVVGAGAGPGLAPVAVGEVVDNSAGTVSALGINYLINVGGTAPPNAGNAGFPLESEMLGEVIAFAGQATPPGWALCDGSLLPVAANRPLFELIGTTYGGDGQESFVLPDLRGRMLTGSH
jgi:microcystin-dependent protein